MKRLAQLHRLSLKGFMLTYFGKDGAEDAPFAMRSDWDVRIKEYLDGVSNQAAALAAWLERNTGVPELRRCTMTGLSRFTCGQKLTTKRTRVCIDCLSDDRRDGRPMFERLLWRLQVVTTCDRHGRALITPGCRFNRPRSQNAPPNLPGVCPDCGSLGMMCMAVADSEAPECSETDIWVTQQCRRLLDAMPFLDCADPARMKANLRARWMCGRGLVAGAEEIGMTGSSLSLWLRKPAAKLMLSRLVDIAMTQQLDLVALVRGDLVHFVGPVNRSPRTTKRILPRVDHAAIARRLKDALESGEPAAQVARDMKISHCTLFRHKELYRQVVEQARVLRERQDTERRRLAVHEAERMLIRLLDLQLAPSLRNAVVVSAGKWMPSSLKSASLACIRVRLGHAGVQLPPRARTFSDELQLMLDESAARIRQKLG